VLFLFLSLLSLYFVQIGIYNYKNVIEKRERFSSFENLKLKQYVTYAQYGTYGMRIMFVPSPLSVFFSNSSLITELTANVDSGERLYIYNSFKGRALFAEKFGGFKDFSGIMLLLGSLLVLYLGYDSLIHKDYLRFLSGFYSLPRIFTAVTLSRLLTIFSFFLFNIACSLILLKLNGLQLSSDDLRNFYIYTGTLLLMTALFFALGTIAGSLRSRFSGFVLLIASWFVLVFLVPGIVNSITSRRVGNIMTDNQVELEKLKLLMSVEKRTYEKVGSLKESNKRGAKQLMEDYWNNEFQEILAFEQKLAREIQNNVDNFLWLSIFSPSPFYWSTGNEISSKGYSSYLEFFLYIQDLKKRFVRFYFDKRYNMDTFVDSATQVESFIKDDENLFFARSRLPGGFFWGLLLTLIYTLALFFFSFRQFRSSLLS